MCVCVCVCVCERERARERERERGCEGSGACFVSIQRRALNSVSQLRSNVIGGPFCLIVYETVLYWLSNIGHIRSTDLIVTYLDCLEWGWVEPMGPVFFGLV